MKKMSVLTVPMLIVVAMLVGLTFSGVTSWANPNPYWIPSQCEYNEAPGAGNAVTCWSKETQEACEKYSYCWWRDTTNQNVISQQTADEFTDQVVTLYTSPALNVYDYVLPFASNIIVITTPSHYMIVGCGGGASEATYAKYRLRQLVAGKTLWGIVMTDANPETIWGCREWTDGQPMPVYAHHLFNDQMEERFFVDTELTERLQRMYGTFLPWGSDGFLGIGFAKENRAVPPQYLQNPSILISENTNITLDGNTIQLIPAVANEEVLMVHLPVPKILIAPFIGKYLPDAGFLAHPMKSSISSWCYTLDYMRTFSPSILATLHTTPIIGASEVQSAILTQRDSLQYIHDSTINKINQHMSLDDMMVSIKLPASLASSPYAAPLTSNVPSIVREVYHYYMGWFDGDPAKLVTLSTYARASRLIALAGGEMNVVKYALKCITEHTQEGTQTALELAIALRTAKPSDQANTIYAQALRVLAWSAESAYLRNYYLSLLQEYESSQVQ